ncbi:MAG: histidine--tRNA ligase [Candidatus Eisenbacteria sp.]|nr:histidine--tRNA ligase [Candidatus Eisenbacteria bacterium]
MRGTRDILPGETRKWQFAEGVFAGVAKRYGCREIRFPIFEATDLFERGIGEMTDIVKKEMYTFHDRKGRSLTLRPEGTASVVRAYLEHSLARRAGVVKLFYMGPMFRYDRPGQGRYRQFHQVGIEFIGSPDPQADVETLEILVGFLKGLGLRNLETRINSLGCPVCRPGYQQSLRDALAGITSSLCEDCIERVERNPLRVLDCKQEKCRLQFGKLPVMLDHLCGECDDHMKRVEEMLGGIRLPYRVDPLLVRGLDYYTRTTYEVHHAGLGSQSALGGGGRYDGLIEQMGGPPTPAVGFSAGLERALLSLDEEGASPDVAENPDVFIAPADETGEREIPGLTHRLRQRFAVERDYRRRNLKSQFKSAADHGARFVIILGEQEVAEGSVAVKDMESGEQAKVPLSAIEEWLEANLASL